MIPVERVEDPTLAYLFRQKQDELDRQITLLTDVDSPRFLHESLQIYGGVSDWLLSQATELLDRVPTRERRRIGPRAVHRGRISPPGRKPSSHTTASSAPTFPPRRASAKTCTPG